MLRKDCALKMLLLILVSMVVSQPSLFSQNTFECDGTMYFNYGNVNSNGTVYIGEYDTTSASTSSTIASNTTFNHNALAYNYLDNYLYAVGNPSRIFYRINSRELILRLERSLELIQTIIFMLAILMNLGCMFYRAT